ncbi:putative AMP-dependent synthetase/ligase, AMP-binding enzyme domain-containing protein [Helianthus annuus]|uniref:AMP-dependent synthetase/ligase, AMP-binding enzyme domain-containing protein n=1 Tax=Helianthus annuus TaxID=4232 RepID=A0A9K3IW62_HELAN|nr:putative AMP-dependent synthetase/ligase, AMP-binding enzyme domain-containing protein [Helianthus annuus]KAJ0561850.1 putative AMP-dependent synthetase/ligase, AMP-binding, AMP-binding enzyme domain, ANL [Helianthus annuus]KAJ0574914.1 putative AMP-dependent synthetase/ligase, AMP-binding, AMP-binding enzyme domain, ANL [Helianthus annuus]KAJ0739244.1 putative AMP-dependent synthetase/ligase, AMP-binding, AMP-binding enzyme domain, ANL [Helianthus annuus]
MEGTIRCEANYVPLSPISFLERSAVVYRDRLSIVYGDHIHFTWRQTRDRCLKLASSLASRFRISRGDVVAVLAPNIPEMYELHFAVPMAGAILCSLNIRHDSAMISTLLKHSAARLIFVDYQFLDVAKGAIAIMSKTTAAVPQLVLIPDSNEVPPRQQSEIMEYEALLAMGNLDFEIRTPVDECDPIALNYTSGTTSSPKGAVYSHRAAQGGTNVCLRAVTAKGIFESISRHNVTHMSGAPTVLNMIINAPAGEKLPLPGKVSVMTGGAPPPSQVVFSMEQMGFNVCHSYGLTETYGPGTICTWKPEWNSLPLETQAKIKSRQGVNHLGIEEVDVKDPATMKSVPWDAKTIGEVMFRGNTVMNGYLNDRKATEEAFKGGWFRSGDLGVRHSDGYIELKDRSKDIIISGGENISTIEVESVLFGHPAVLEAAVVGRPDDHWGETPCAFVKLKEGYEVNRDELIAYCRKKLPHYMAPRTVVFGELPKTSTGKTQKFLLREKTKAMGSLASRGKSKL